MGVPLNHPFLIGCSINKPSILGCPYFRQPPNLSWRITQPQPSKIAKIHGQAPGWGRHPTTHLFGEIMRFQHHHGAHLRYPATCFGTFGNVSTTYLYLIILHNGWPMIKPFNVRQEDVFFGCDLVLLHVFQSWRSRRFLHEKLVNTQPVFTKSASRFSPRICRLIMATYCPLMI